MTNILPPKADVIIDKGYRLPNSVTFRSREYLSAGAYCDALGEAAYEGAELSSARRSGLPHITVALGQRLFYYYNLEDSQRWHAGEAV